MLAPCSGAGRSFSLGDVGFKLLLALLGLLFEFAEDSFLRCSWPVVRQVNFRRQIREVVPQPRSIEKVAFARFNGHRHSTVNIAVESRECAGALRVGNTMIGDSLL